MINVEELQDIIINDIQGIGPERPNESVDIVNAVGRTLAEDVISPVDIPSAPTSAMDGYATLIDGDLATEDTTYECIGESIAGKPFTGNIKPGQCIRIMTGAVAPAEANTIVMQEHIERIEESSIQIRLTKDVKCGSNLRLKGEELKAGDTVLHAGRVITVTDVPLLAGVACSKVNVYTKIKVGILSSGDELCEPGDTLKEGQIYDSNRPALMALLQDHPVTITDYGIIRDDLDVIKSAILTASQENDVVVTSGGVSVGDYDFMKDAVTELGDIVHYKVAMKPGKPFVYGRIGKARYFGLPGNPLSTSVSARLFLIPALYRYTTDVPQRLEFKGKLENPIKRKKADRAELQRGFAQQGAQGEWVVHMANSQESHRVQQLSQANVLVYVPVGCKQLDIGEMVTLLPVNSIFF